MTGGRVRWHQCRSLVQLRLEVCLPDRSGASWTSCQTPPPCGRMPTHHRKTKRKLEWPPVLKPAEVVLDHCMQAEGQHISAASS